MEVIFISKFIQIAGRTDLPDPAYNGIQWSIQDIDYDAGRAADGTMQRNRVARKRKVNVTWPPMSKANVSKVLSSMTAESFTVTAWDFEANGYVTMNAYVGDRTINYLSDVLNSNGLCDSFTCDFVEM